MRAYFRTHPFFYAITVCGLVVLAGVCLWIVIGMFQPMPPRTVTMATGSEGGAYHEFGKRYREVLKQAGIDLKLVSTTGALENLNKLNDPNSQVSVGFLQGGTASASASPHLESLGTVFYEPLWFFTRFTDRELELKGLQGRRISIGPEGSGTRAVSLELLAKNGITEHNAELVPLTFQSGSEKLLGGEIDAMFILAAWDSPVVQRLIAAEDVNLANFPHADAFVALYPFLSKVMVPAGVGDMQRNRPATDSALLAAKASLVVRSDVHPAIQYLLLDAAEQVHAGAGIFQKTGQFPTAESVDLPLSDEARRYYRSGKPFLQRYLPFWLAVMISRLLLVLIPFLGILYPLFRFMPMLYGWKMQRRIYKLYNELKSIEQAWESRPEESSMDNLLLRLSQLERRADHLWLPLSCMGTLYMFKEHVALVRERLKAHPGQP